MSKDYFRKPIKESRKEKKESSGRDLPGLYNACQRESEYSSARTRQDLQYDHA